MAQNNANQPIGNGSEIKDYGFFVRRITAKQQTCELSENQSLQFPRHDPIVELHWMGRSPQPLIPPLPPNPLWWYLTLRGYLQLLAVGVGPHTNDSGRRYLFDALEFRDQFGNRLNPIVKEYGLHLYVAYFGTLSFMKIFKNQRNLQFQCSAQNPIFDVLPKQRLNYNETTNAWQPITVKQLFVFRQKYNASQYSSVRWWYRYGREQKSRFFESDGHDRDGMLEVMEGDLFGVYLFGRSRLVITDTLADGRHNHTLVLGGVFVVVNATFRLAFADSIDVKQEMRELVEMKALQRDTPLERPIVLLGAVPSMAETLCWCLTVYKLDGVFRSHLEVPISGWRVPQRIEFREWNAGLAYVTQHQENMQNIGFYEYFLPKNHTQIQALPSLRSEVFDNMERTNWPHVLLP